MSQENTSSPRILGFFAHPDDELSVGGTLARYAAGGASVTLICATRGEAANMEIAFRNGATDYVSKPVNGAELLLKVRSIVG